MQLNTKIFDKDGNPIKFFVITKNGYQHTYQIIDSEGKQLGYVSLAEEHLGAPTFKKYLIIGQLHNTSPNREYRNVGTALHELVFRLSFAKKYQTNGNIKVDIGYESLLFHYHCGFRLHPRVEFEWDCLGKKFLNHEQFGKAAYEQWCISRFDATTASKLLKKSSANHVLAFYYSLYAEDKDQTNRAYLRRNLAKLGGLLGYLSQDYSTEKEEFSIDVELISQASSSAAPGTFFYSTSQKETIAGAIQHDKDDAQVNHSHSYLQNT